MGGGMSQVLPGLYVGSLSDAFNTTKLDENGITHIVSVQDTAKLFEQQQSLNENGDAEASGQSASGSDGKRNANKNSGSKKERVRLKIVASDRPHEILTPHVPQVNDFIHNARITGGAVLVHCMAGVSRSVSLVTAYVMTATDLSYRDSFRVVRSARRQANPNFGFKTQLQGFEKSKGLEMERVRFRTQFPLKTDRFVESDKTECQRLLVHFERWVQYGDLAKDSDLESDDVEESGEWSGSDGEAVSRRWCAEAEACSMSNRSEGNAAVTLSSVPLPSASSTIN